MPNSALGLLIKAVLARQPLHLTWSDPAPRTAGDRSDEPGRNRWVSRFVGRLGCVTDRHVLRAGIERHLEELSAEAERLQAALGALDGAETSSAVSSKRGASPARSVRRRARPPGDSRGSVLDAPVQQAPTIAEIVSAVASGRDSAVVGASEPHDGVAGLAPATLAERVIAELRRELSAGLRNGRR